MNTTKTTSVLLMTLIAGSPFVFGAASDGYSSNSGRHFRSPPRFVADTTQPGEAEAPEPEKPAAKPRKGQTSQADDSLFPPTAKPGECYTRVLVPPPTRDVSERLLVKEKSERLIEVPAVLEEAEERVIVRAASKRQEVIPATYKEVEEKILVAPAYVKQIPVPARYEDRTERVLVKAERSYWKKGSGPLAKIDNTTGEIMCYVTDPAVYENVTRSVQVAPASVREEQVPAVYKTVKRTVIDKPASIKTIDIPAEYDTVKVTRVKTPASVKRETIPAEYRNVTKKVADGESHLAWRRIICETNVTPVLISDLQSALNTKGYKAGEPTGKLNSETLKALESFQSANNLSQGGITIESLDALGVKH